MGILFTPLVTQNVNILSVSVAEADHCGGAAPGHPGPSTGPNAPPCSAFIGGSNSGAGGSAQLSNPLQFNSISGVLYAILDVLLILAVPVIIFFIVYAGFLYVTAQGNATKIQDANRALTYALIGGVIVLGARVIGSIIQSTVGSITPGL